MSIIDSRDSYPTFLVGERVEVYRNLTRKCYSVRQKGRVIAHVSELVLLDATFHVSESGRQRVIKEKKKNVHAWVKGTVYKNISLLGWGYVTYAPHRDRGFVLINGGPPQIVTQSKYVRLSHNGCVFLGVTQLG